ncbi:MAG: hypothetical protein IH599_08425, partial [Bacteroidales bacterium]|nr:hypothetical protein [Bacteroidales bacterium]
IIPGGDSTYCKGGNGVDVAMFSSQSTALYDLYLNGNLLWPDVSGNGSGFSFGLMQASGKYTVVASDSLTGCSAPMTGSVTVVIDSLPIVYGVSGGGSYCAFSTGPQVYLSGSETGVEYTLIRNGNINTQQVVAGTGGPVSFLPQQTAGVYTVTALNPLTGCTRIMAGSATVTILPLPAVNVTTPGDLCFGDPGLLLATGTPAGGTYSGFGINAGIITNTIDIGQRTLYYSVTHPTNGCINTDSITYTVHALPQPDLGPDTSFCEQGSVTIGSTGVFTAYLWDNGSPAAARTLNSGGLYHLTVTDIHGCMAADTILVTMDSLPQLNLQPFPSVCIDAAPLTLNQASPAGGTYFGMGVSGTTFTPLMAGTGTFGLTYIYNDPVTGCQNSTSGTITVNPLPSVSLSGLPEVCISSTPFPLTGGVPSGGSFSGPGVTGGVFSPAVGSGNHILTYAFTHPVTGCANTAMDTLVVHPLPVLNAPTLPAVCAGSPAFLLPAGIPAGGTWQGPGVNAGSYTPPAAPATFTFWYHYQDPLTSCRDSISRQQVVHPLPVVTFQSNQQACEGDTPFPLMGGLPTGGSYSGPLYSAGMFVPLFAGNYTMTYTWQDPSTLCQNAATDIIPVFPVPTVSLSGLPSPCVSDPPFPLSGGQPLGGTYLLNGQPYDTLYPSSLGSGNLSLFYVYNDSNGCGDTASVLFDIHPLPVVQQAPLPGVCLNDLPLILSGGSPVGGTYSGPGLIGNIFHPNADGTYTLQYHFEDPITHCSDSVAFTVTVYPLPSVALGSAPAVCLNASPVSLSGGSPAGGTYQGNGITNGIFYPSTGVGSHPYAYTYQDPLNGCRDTAWDTLEVMPLPQLSLALPGPFCLNDPDTLLLGGSPQGGTYGGLGISGSVFQPSASGIFPVFYTYQDSASGCRDTANGSIVVHPLPILSLSTWPDLCAGDAPFALMPFVMPGGGTWTGTGVAGSSFDPQISGPGNFELSYTYT